jgi:DNA-binding LacI/PurR family transcriptional regulator
MKELLYRKIYLHFKAEITEGRLISGDRLPGVRETSDEWNTSPNTVLKALAELESDGLIRKTRGQGIFVMDRAAWSDSSAPARELGIILYDMNDPFNLKLLSAVEKAAAAKGYKLSVGSGGRLASSGISGLVVVPSSAGYFDSAVTALSGIPVIYTGKFSPPQDFRGHYIIADVYSGFFHAAERLLKSGRERFAYIGGGDEPSEDPGRSAVQDVLAGTKYGFRREYAVSAGGFDLELGVKAMDDLLLNDEYPDAVLCSNDTLAAGAIKACKGAGLNVPDDICIIGAGDQDIAPVLEPSLTSLRVPAEFLGTMAADFLDELVKGGIAPDEKIRGRLDLELIIRASALSAEQSGRNLVGADGIVEGTGDEGLWL